MPNRIKRNDEIYTPSILVEEILDKFPQECWLDPSKTWLDPTCGEGAFLVAVKNRLLKYHSENHILDNMIFGVELEQDSIEICIAKLYGEGMIEVLTGTNIPFRKGLIAMFKHNGKLIEHIVQADGLIYEYNFDEKNHTDGFLTW